LALIALKDEEASHILLVPIVMAWLFWVRRCRVRMCAAKFSFTGTAITLTGAAISYWGVGNGIQSFWHLGSVLMAMGCAVTVLGFDVLRRFFPVFLIMLFLVPVPPTIRIAMSLPLQQFLAQAVQNVLELVGVMVQRSGNLLSINGIDVTVVEACNGLRMVFGLILVAAAFALGTPMRWQVRAMILCLSPVIAIVLNMTRLVPTMLLFGYTNVNLAHTFHDVSGWVMLPLAFLLLLGVLRLVRWLCLPVMPYAVAYS
jgi:exosortase